MDNIWPRFPIKATHTHTGLWFIRADKVMRVDKQINNAIKM